MDQIWSAIWNEMGTWKLFWTWTYRLDASGIKDLITTSSFLLGWFTDKLSALTPAQVSCELRSSSALNTHTGRYYPLPLIWDPQLTSSGGGWDGTEHLSNNSNSIIKNIVRFLFYSRFWSYKKKDTVRVHVVRCMVCVSREHDTATQSRIPWNLVWRCLAKFDKAATWHVAVVAVFLSGVGESCSSTTPN